MSNVVKLDVDALLDGIDRLFHEGRALYVAEQTGELSRLNAFCMVPGFHEAGSQLGRVARRFSGQGHKVNGDHIRDAANLSEANLLNMTRIDGCLSGSLKGIQLIAQEEAGYGVNRKPIVNNMASPIFFDQPIAHPPSTIAILEAGLGKADLGAIPSEIELWSRVQSDLESAIEALFEVKQSYSTSMETAWVQQADHRINQIQHATNAHAQNAAMMMLHVGALGTATESEAAMAAVAALAASVLPAPQRPIYEQLYLNTYGGRATGSLQTTVPTFEKLIPDLSDMPGTPFTLNDRQTPPPVTFDPAPLPKLVQDSFTAMGHPDLAHARTPDDVVRSYGHVNPDVLDAIRSGATQTQAASVAAPSMPPSLHPGINPGGGAGGLGGGLNPAGANTGAAGLGQTFGGAGAGAGSGSGSGNSAGGYGAGAAGRGGVSGGATVGGTSTGGNVAGGNGAGRNVAGSGAGRLGGIGAGNGTGGGTGNGSLRGAAGQIGSNGLGQTAGRGAGLGTGSGIGNLGGAGGSGIGAGAGRGGMGFGAGGGFGGPGSGSGAGAGGTGGFGSGAGSPGGAVATGAGSPGSAGAGTGSGQGGFYGGAGANGHGQNQGQGRGGRGGGFGGMGGAYGAGASRGGRGEDGKPGKVQAVTSAVEREGNLRALLGEGPLVLPTVIGDSVRD